MSKPWDNPLYPVSTVMYGLGVSTTPHPETTDWEEYLQRLRERIGPLPLPGVHPVVTTTTSSDHSHASKSDLDALIERVSLLERAVLALTELHATRAAARKKKARTKRKPKKCRFCYKPASRPVSAGGECSSCGEKNAYS